LNRVAALETNVLTLGITAAQSPIQDALAIAASLEIGVNRLEVGRD
jgi:hypothetical protein